MKTLSSFTLLPAPREIIDRTGLLPVRGIREIVLAGDPALLRGAALRLQSAARLETGAHLPVRAAFPNRSGASPAITLALDPKAGIPDQGYVLDISAKDVTVTAPAPSGVFYGVMTLVQALRQSRGALPFGRIKDHPDFPARGVMLDISRDKVPTLETLFDLVDLLAEWKINHLELYTEHTFAYRNHEAAWKNASPMTPQDILRLDAYCRERFIELVPNQNSFGHLGRWLKLPAYRDLAEAPDGAINPWTQKRSPIPETLNPRDPRCLALLAELYDELLPNFTSHKFNVGCDETWDLGQGRSKAICDRRGKGRVYLDFLLNIHKLVKARGRTMHFWGDIIIKHPELVAELPKDVVVLEWGYEADHPFAEHCPKYSASGLPFYVCPGTSSWNSIAGRTDNCIGNIHNAAKNGVANGAVGFLITDWGDNGFWQYLPVSYLGFAAGAGVSWCYRSNVKTDIRRALDLHCFRDDACVMGKLVYDLGNAYTHSGGQIANSSVLFRCLHADQPGPWPGVTAARLAATRRFVEGTLAKLPSARMRRPDAALIMDELRNAGRMLAAGCDRGSVLFSGRPLTASQRNHFAALMRTIVREHRRLWLSRNRAGGLRDSLRVLRRRLREADRP